MLTAKEIIAMCQANDLTSPGDCSRIQEALIERSQALPLGQREGETLLCRAVSAVHRNARQLREARLSEVEQIDRLLRAVANHETMPSDAFRPVLRSRSVEYASRLAEAYGNYQAVLARYEATAKE